MLARDLMTTEVVTVTPETPVRAVARLLAERGISGVPVVEANGRLAGVLTEGDLLRKLAGTRDKPVGWFRQIFASVREDARRYARTHARAARDAMTAEVETVRGDTPVEEVAAVMERRGVRRVPVVSAEGRLLGVVSRADLLDAVLAAPDDPVETSDEGIRRRVLAEMRRQPWANTAFTFADVREGVVTFYGARETAEVERALRVLAEGVPGVREVRFDLVDMPTYLYAA